MRRLIIIAVALLSTVFYISSTSYEISGYFDNDGFVFSNNAIQSNLYTGKSEVENVNTIEVKAQDPIYTLWSSEYAGETGLKKKINKTYPMYFKDGVAIQFLSEGARLIDSNFKEYGSYKGLIINNGSAFNVDYSRADTMDYIFTRLTNGLYINNQQMNVETIANKYKITLNSFLYLTPDFIRVYSYNDGYFTGMNIDDVSEGTWITIGDERINYTDLLLNLGETALVEEKEKAEEPVEETEEVKEEEKQSLVEKIQNLVSSNKDKGNKNDKGENSKEKEENQDVPQEIEDKDTVVTDILTIYEYYKEDSQAPYGPEKDDFSIAIKCNNNNVDHQNATYIIKFGDSPDNCVSDNPEQLNDVGETIVCYKITSERTELTGSYILRVKPGSMADDPNHGQSNPGQSGTGTSSGGSQGGGSQDDPYAIPTNIKDQSYVYNGNPQGASINNQIGLTSGSYNVQYKKDVNDEWNSEVQRFVNEGDYTVYFKITADGYTDKEGTYKLIIKPANISIIKATNEFTYDGFEHGDGINAITVDNSQATIKYGLNNNDYNLNDAPQFINAGTHTVYYQVSADNHKENLGSYNVVINKAKLQLTNTENKTYIWDGELHGDGIVAKDYDGQTVSSSNISYGTTNGVYDLNNAPQFKDIGDYTVYYKVDLENHEVTTGSYVVKIISEYNAYAKTLKAIINDQTFTYNGTQRGNAVRAVFDNGDVCSSCVIRYGDNQSSIDLEEAPQLTTPGERTIYYQVSLKGFEPVSGSYTVKVVKADFEVEAPDQVYTYNNGIAFGEAVKVKAADSLSSSPISYKVEYKVGSDDYSEDVPKLSEVNSVTNNSKTITVTYKVSGDYHNDKTGTYKITLNKRNVIYTNPRIKAEPIHYNGREFVLANKGSSSAGGTIWYKVRFDKEIFYEDYLTDGDRLSEFGGLTYKDVISDGDLSEKLNSIYEGYVSSREKLNVFYEDYLDESIRENEFGSLDYSAIKLNQNLYVSLSEKYNDYINNFANLNAFYNQEIVFKNLTDEEISAYRIDFAEYLLNKGYAKYYYKNILSDDNKVNNGFIDSNNNIFEYNNLSNSLLNKLEELYLDYVEDNINSYFDSVKASDYPKANSISDLSAKEIKKLYEGCKADLCDGKKYLEIYYDNYLPSSQLPNYKDSEDNKIPYNNLSKELLEALETSYRDYLNEKLDTYYESVRKDFADLSTEEKNEVKSKFEKYIAETKIKIVPADYTLSDEYFNANKCSESSHGDDEIHKFVFEQNAITKEIEQGNYYIYYRCEVEDTLNNRGNDINKTFYIEKEILEKAKSSKPTGSDAGIDDDDNGEHEIEWTKPVVTLESFEVGVSSFRAEVDVIDGANVLVDSKITFQVLANYEPYASQYENGTINDLPLEYSRAVSVNAGFLNDITIDGLKSLTPYHVVGYFSYIDANGKKITEQFCRVPIKTADSSTLGTIYLKDFELDSAQIYSDRISIPSIAFDMVGDEYFNHKSEWQAVNYLKFMEVIIQNHNNSKDKYILRDVTAKEFSALKSGETISFMSRKVLKEGQRYDVTLKFYGQDNNEFTNVSYEPISIITCLKEPVASLKYTKVSSDFTSYDFEGTIEPTQVVLKNYKLKVYDNNSNVVYFDNDGNMVPEGTSDAKDYIALSDDIKGRIKNLAQNSNYTVSLLATYNLRDGKGDVERVLTSKSILTSALSELGRLELTTKDMSSTLLTKEELTYKAIFDVSVNAKTNPLLIDYLIRDIDNVNLSLNLTSQNNNEEFSYSFTKTELLKILSGDTLQIDTMSSKFAPKKLSSNSTYTISYSLNVDGNEHATKSSLTKLSTPMVDMKVNISSLQAGSGFITSTFRVEDKDKMSVEDNIYLNVYKVNYDDDDNYVSESIVASFGASIGYEFKLGVFSDQSYIYDVATDTYKYYPGYNIEPNSQYVFRFVTEEAITNEGRKYNYNFFSTAIDDSRLKTSGGLEGNIYLTSLSIKDNPLPDGYIALEYIEATGTQYIKTGIMGDAEMTYDIQFTNPSARQLMGYGGSSDEYWGTLNGQVELACQRKFGNSQKRQTIIWEYNYKGRKALIIDGVQVNGKNEKGGISVDAREQQIFAINGGYLCQAKLYSMQIKQKGVSVRDYVPVLKDGVTPGLYDRVNDVFYENAGKGVFKYQLNKDTVFDATVKYTVKTIGSSAQEDDRQVYVDIYKVKDGIESLVHEKYSFAYIKDGYGSIENFVCQYDSNPNNKYIFKLYYEYSYYDTSGTENIFKVPLNQVSFSTDLPVNEIRNLNEFFDVKTRLGKYVVTNDLYLCDADGNTLYDEDGNPIPYTINSVHWADDANALRASIDFQGFSLNVRGRNPLIGTTTTTAELLNVVYRATATNSYETSVISNAAALVSTNKGLISNVYMEFDESLTYMEDNPYQTRYATYWTDSRRLDINDKEIHYLYRGGSGLVYSNYGIIENFVINCKSDLHVTDYSGLVTVINNAKATVRNGYVYSSLNEDSHKVNIDVYGQYSSYTTNTYGAVVGKNNGGGVVENVYALANIDIYYKNTSMGNGIVLGYSDGSVTNAYGVGETVYNNGSFAQPSFTTSIYGPAVGRVSNIVDNVYFVSTRSYPTSQSYTYNNDASILNLKSTKWQNDILNNGNGSFNVDSLVAVGCYPQVNYTSNSMPNQELLLLPSIDEGSDKRDIIGSSAYEWDDETINEIFLKDLTADELSLINYDVENGKYLPERNEVWDESDAVGIYKSNLQAAVITISDKEANNIGSVTIDGLKTKLMGYLKGDGVTNIYLYVYNPNEALSTFRIRKIEFEQYLGSSIKPIEPSGIRNLKIDFFRKIYDAATAEDLINLIHTTDAEKTIGINISIQKDLDFSNYSIIDLFCNGTYTGKIEGNGHSLYGFKFVNAKDTDIYGDKLAIFNNLKGTVKNLTIQGLSFEGGQYSAVLAADVRDTMIENVFVTDCYVGGGNVVGGLIAKSGNGTRIRNSGVSDTILLSTNTSANEMDVVEVGGLIGEVNALTTIDYCYTQDIYIENFIGGNSKLFGGLIARMSGAYSQISNSYSSGVFNGVCDAVGGLVGYNSSYFEIYNCYSDFDIATVNANAGGVVGRSFAATKTSNVESFGNIISSAIIDNGKNKSGTESIYVSKICQDSTNVSNAAYYNNAILDIKSYDASGKIVTTSSTSTIGLGPFYAEGVTTYLDTNNTYLNITKPGTLPVIVDDNGDIIGDQKVTLLSESLTNNEDGSTTYDTPISITSISTSGNTVEINLRVESNVEQIKIDDVYTDYSYILDTLNYDLEPYGKVGIRNFKEVAAGRIDSQISHKALNYTVSKSDSSQGDYVNWTIRLNGGSDFINSYYDLYKVTAIKYSTNDGETHYLKVNRNLNINPQHKEISNIDEWTTFFSRKSIGENIKLTGDIDFAGKDLYYNNENIANVTVNRIVGTRSGNYLALKDDSSADLPFVTIKNVTLNSYKSDGITTLYDGFSGLIRSSLSEIGNISFDDINISNSDRVGIIGTAIGDVHDITITNTNIKGTSSKSDVGFIAYSEAYVNKVYLHNVDVSSIGSNVGGIAGKQEESGRHIGIYNIYADGDVKITSSGSSVGVIAGCVNRYQSFAPSYFAGSTYNLINVNVKASGSNVGGAIGYYKGINGNYGIATVNLVDSTITGDTNVGGAIGYLASDYIRYAYVYNSEIRGNGTVGGVMGSGNTITDSTVEKSLIIGTGSNVGGAVGTGSIAGVNTASAGVSPRVWVIESKVYGNTNVGGIGGSGYIAGFVKDSEIYGNTNVGGDMGSVTTTASCFSAYIENVLIQPIKEKVYGIEPTSHTYFGGFAGYGGRVGGIVKNCVIGDETVNYSGGSHGRLVYNANNAEQVAAIVEDSVVLGNQYVSGLFGTIGKDDNSYNTIVLNCMSNAYVIGNQDVSGIASYISGNYVKISNQWTYRRIPTIESCYFTGTLESKDRVSATVGRVYGYVKGISEFKLSGVVSMPESITGQNIDLVMMERTADKADDNYYLSNLNLETTNQNTTVSLWADTMINQLNSSGTIASSMKLIDYIDASRYGNNYTFDLDEFGTVADSFKKYIYIFDNNIYNSDFEDQTDNTTSYSVVDYIESGSNQYIKLDNLSNIGTRIVLKYQSNTTSEQPIFGSRYNSSYGLSFWTTGYMHFGAVSTKVSGYQFNNKSEHVVDLSGDGIYVDDTKMNASIGRSFNGASLPIYLFGTNNNTSMNGTYFNGKIFYAKIYDYGELVADLVPVVRDSDNKVGMYDLVNDKFYVSSTATSFTAGPTNGDKVIAQNVLPSDDTTYILDNLLNEKILNVPHTIPTSGSNEKWTINKDNYLNCLMPFTTTSADVIRWNQFLFGTYTPNPITGESFYADPVQEIHVPGSEQAKDAQDRIKNLYSQYIKFKNNELTYDDFVDKGLNTQKVTANIDAYVSSGEVINVDLSNDITNVYNQYSTLSSSTDGNEFIDLGITYIDGITITGGNGLVGNTYESGSLTNVVGNGSIKVFGLGSIDNHVSGSVSNVVIKDSQDNVIKDLIPVQKISYQGEDNGLVGLYDKVSGKVYTAKNGSVTLSGDVTKFYPYGIKISAQDGNNTVYVVGNETEYATLDKLTYSIQTDFKSNLVLEFYTPNNGVNEYQVKTVVPDKVVRKASLYNDLFYYIDPNTGYLYSSADTSTPLISEKFVNIYGDRALDSNGKLYQLHISNTGFNLSNGVDGTPYKNLSSQDYYLHSYSAPNDDKYYTYGIYTLVNDGTNNSVTYNRNYGLGLILNENYFARYDDFFTNSKFKAYLKEGRSIVSIGSENLIDYLKTADTQDVSFINGGIINMTTNINSTLRAGTTTYPNSVEGTKYVLFTYADGSILGYDISGTTPVVVVNARKINSSTNMSMLSEVFEASEGSLFASFTSFMKASFTSLFSFEDETTESKLASTNDLIDTMESYDMTLNQVVERTSAPKMKSRSLFSTLFSNDDEEKESSLIDTPNNVEENKEQLIHTSDEEKDMIISSNVGANAGPGEKTNSDGLLPSIEGITDGTVREKKNELIKEDMSGYVALYNAETDDFDIYSKEELVNNPTDPVSENFKVVDKSKLKALYDSLGERDKDNTHGFVLYALIAVAISLLVMIFIVVDKKNQYRRYH